MLSCYVSYLQTEPKLKFEPSRPPCRDERVLKTGERTIEATKRQNSSPNVAVTLK